MSDLNISTMHSQYSNTLRDCRKLYVTSGELCVRQCPTLLKNNGEGFVELMDDLHRALILKIYISVCEADRKWSKQERFLAEITFNHLWKHWLSEEDLVASVRKASTQSSKIRWYSLYRPFDRFAILRERVGELETIVMRMANLIARIDNNSLHPAEAAIIRTIQEELHHHLRPIPIDGADQHSVADELRNQAIETMQQEASQLHRATDERLVSGNPNSTSNLYNDDAFDIRSSAHPGSGTSKSKQTDNFQQQEAIQTEEKDSEFLLEESLQELDKLIGLGAIKQEVRSLTNYIKLQQKREEAGLPETEISLHMVFNGNPGTGKTTVARLVGKIFGAMGVLEKGHLVETDRSGLVAEFAGQTGPKTNAKLDEAMDGVLFIDEAYSLVAKEGDDPYGREAVQALLKRAEDNRDRLVVILAGYPDEMRFMLKSNPGLSSRFNRQLTFEDYHPVELGKIFEWMCDKNKYILPSEARAKILLGMHYLYQKRDKHFGNGRAARNLFEHAIRQMANRLAGMSRISHKDLTTFTAEDIRFKKLPETLFTESAMHSICFQITCPACLVSKEAPTNFLGKNVKCPACKHRFTASWGSPIISG